MGGKAFSQKVAQRAFAGIEFAKHEQDHALLKVLGQAARGLQAGPLLRPARLQILAMLVDGLGLLGQRVAGLQARYWCKGAAQALMQRGLPGLQLLQARMQLRKAGLVGCGGASARMGQKWLLAGHRIHAEGSSASSALKAARAWALACSWASWLAIRWTRAWRSADSSK